MPDKRRLRPIVNHNRLSSSLRKLRSVAHREDLCPALSELCAGYGFAHMTFLIVRAGGATSSPPYFCTTYPDAWSTAYVEKGYFDIDPVIDVMRQDFLPVDWSALDWRSRPAGRLFNEARSYGIGSQGLTIPIRGANGERSLFSVTSNLPRRQWIRLRDSRVHEMQLLSHYLHETVFDALAFRKSARMRKLSGRESQCLQLLAMGRISKQIAADLGISENAVKLYLRSARMKLRALTTYHAVAKASFLELIKL